MIKSKLKFIDLFAGIGGFHSALHQLGCECVFASEIDEAARDVYKKNYFSISRELFEKKMFNDDIRKISPAEIPDFDILCAGFPCQPFSQAGFKEGFADGKNSERGNLFFNIVDIIEEKKPKAFFLENVRGIVNHDHGRTFKIIRQILEDELGYSFYFKVVKATDYGLPQHRPRAFMIGFRDEGFLKGFSFPPKVPLKFNMSDVFGGSCSREIGFTLRVGGAGSKIDDRRNWDSYLVDNEVVRIEPAHALMIQGFPSNFYLPKSKREAMKQLGNSVAVDAIKSCAEALIHHLSVIEKLNEGKNQMPSNKNKGEWTELYTFLKLIYEKKIYLSDRFLNVTNDYFNVKKVTTLNIKEHVILNKGEITVSDGISSKKYPDGKLFTNNDLDKFKNNIIDGSKTFSMDGLEAVFKALGISIVNGGNSSQKADIVLDISRLNEGYINEGFGIKSYLGSHPTLLNASGSNTNFIYEIVGFNDVALTEANKIDSKAKIKDRLSFILLQGGTLNFVRVEAESMNYNLAVLDAELPELISMLLINYYFNRYNSISENLANLHLLNNFKNKSIVDEKGHIIKIKRLLIAALLGFFTGTNWDGKFTSNGTIVVNSDGSQVAFHITKADVLENYLFDTIKFDTPSTTRHRFASVYKERNGKFYIKLNLQLRFA
jgi:DNA (cytosine-5)-methyltransferase 1